MGLYFKKFLVFLKKKNIIFLFLKTFSFFFF